VYNFSFSLVPKIEFGENKIHALPKYILNYGSNIILVTGGNSLDNSGKYEMISCLLRENNIDFHRVQVLGEPSPYFIDEIVKNHREEKIDLVVAIGGGSVIDTGKAISAMFLLDESTVDFLELPKNTKKHPGNKLPFIAMPTTSGTGSEATKNAVLSHVSSDGFKKSLRHSNFIPNVAIIDPIFMVNTPTKVTISSGLDAFTQLLGAYLSTKSNPLSDALALSGIEAFSEGFNKALEDEKDLNARASLAYAAFLSGIVLANVGLGIVHGIAGPLGGYFNIPHGTACATLLGEAIKLNINKLTYDEDTYYLEKYAKVGRILSNDPSLCIQKGCTTLINYIDHIIDTYKIPRLREYGITENSLDKIIKSISNKNNPTELSYKDMEKILKNRL
jgi:alcohol dehydrogenase class IV